MQDPRKKLLIIFDVDETLIHFDKKAKKKGKEPLEFRPGVCEMLKMLDNDPFFHVGLWTYSDGEYLNYIVEKITEHCGLSSNFFKCLLYDTYIDLDEDEIIKNLSVFYDKNIFKDLIERVTEYEEEHMGDSLYLNQNLDWLGDGKVNYFNTFNTVLVDDRYNNMSSPQSLENGILIEPFHDNKNDDICKRLMMIFGKLKTNIMNYSKNDLNSAFKKNAIMSFDRVKKMNMLHYYKKYKIDFNFVREDGKKIYKPMHDKIANRLKANGLLSQDKSEIIFFSVGKTHQGENNGGFTLMDDHPLKLNSSISPRKTVKKCCPIGYELKCVPKVNHNTMGGSRRKRVTQRKMRKIR